MHLYTRIIGRNDLTEPIFIVFAVNSQNIAGRVHCVDRCALLIGYMVHNNGFIPIILSIFRPSTESTIEQAYFLYEFDGAPKEFEDAMLWYDLACKERFGHAWCRYTWRAKVAWKAYKRVQGFPLAVAVALSTT